MIIKNSISATGSAASASITVPSSVSDGDWLVLFIHSNYSLSSLGGLAFAEVYKSNTNYRGLYVGYRQASANDAGALLSMTFAGSEPYCAKLYVIDGTSVGSIAGGAGIAYSNTVNHSISYSFSAGQEVLLSASNRASSTLTFNQGIEVERTSYNSGADLYIAATHFLPTSPISVSGSGSAGAVLGFVVFNDANHKPPLETLTFSYTGAVQPYTFEPGKYRIKCYGAQGGYRSAPANGGQGGYAEGILTLTEQTMAYIYVGGSGNTGGQSGGFNGGGVRTNNLPGGGGASDIRLGTDSLFARVIVAGGGGSDGSSSKPGGNGGGLTGVSRTESYGSGGGGGTQTAGGAGGNNNSGSFGFGGEGQYRSSGYGGAGGGGWYGGGGVYPDGSGDDDRGGGGGSGYVFTAESAKPEGYLLGAEYLLTETVLTQGGRNGDGLVVIEVIEIGKQKYLARDAEGIKAWKGEISAPKTATVIAERWAETTGGTTLSASVSAAVGNTVVAAVTTRSETDFSDGWVIISRLTGFSTTNQNLYVLAKTAENETESITVTQTASARIYIQLLAFSKFLTLTEQWKTSTPDDAVTAVSVPNKTAGAKTLWVLSANLWTTASPYGKWTTNPSDLMRYSAQADVQDRQAVFFDNGTGAAGGRTFTTITTAGIGGIMLQIAEDIGVEGHWETVGDYITEELFLEHGTDRLPLSVDGLLDDAEILLWTDRAKVLSEPERFVFHLTAGVSAPTQTITQTVPFELPDGAAVSRVSIVADEQYGGVVSGKYSVDGSGIAFTYTLDKPTAESTVGIKKVNIYFTEE